MHAFCVFFFKQKTAYELRISDWSSDVCSSDLAPETRAAFLALALSRPASFLSFRFQPSVRHLWAPGLAEPNHILPSVASSVFAGRYMHRNTMCEVEVSTVCA